MLLVDYLLIASTMAPGQSVVLLAIPAALILWASRIAASRTAQNELIRVVFPPLILIVAVLGSILGGITNPTPAAALGAAGAIMLAAYRKLKEEGNSGWVVIWATYRGGAC